MKMRHFFFWLCSALTFCSSVLEAQQLIVSSQKKIILRCSPGDVIILSMHQKRGRHQREIKGFTDHALILGSDTVNISDISRIGIMQGEYSKKFRTPGFKILLAGILLGLGDLITVTAVQHKDYDVHKGVAIVSAGLIATGTLMILIKPSTRIGRKNRLLIVTDESPLYKTR